MKLGRSHCSRDASATLRDSCSLTWGCLGSWVDMAFSREATKPRRLGGGNAALRREFTRVATGIKRGIYLIFAAERQSTAAARLTARAATGRRRGGPPRTGPPPRSPAPCLPGFPELGRGGRSRRLESRFR